MRVATFNVASIRARLPIVLEWLAENEPDVLALQETKVEDDKFPIDDFEEMGYHLAVHGQKSWNGVALASRLPAADVQIGFCDAMWPDDARIISARFRDVRVINTYVPNGNTVGSDKWDYKLRWLERFGALLHQRYRADEPLIWLGDINIAPTPNDVYNSKKFYGGVGHHPDEFTRLNKILDFGLVDTFRHLYPEAVEYTFWDFVITNSLERDYGWRIDHIYASACLLPKLTQCKIDRPVRLLPRPSDHTVVFADFRD